MKSSNLFRPSWRRTPAALASLTLMGAICAQAQTTLAPVIVTSPASPPASVSGWGDVPPAKAPFQATSYELGTLRDRGVQRLSDITRIDPAVSDSYNTEGYWDYLTVRGYVIDNRFNYRRDGLPISAETSIPLDNKERIEVLRGTSGLQAGTSAPGGLVNLVVKRPLAEPLRSARVEWQQRGSLLGAVDLSQRLGANEAFGLRVNAAYQQLDPLVRSAQGERRLLAVAGDWRVSPDTLLEAEIETSHRRQPSVPGFSLLGPQLPLAGDPRINLNNQSWSKPVVMDADNLSLRLQQRLSADWRLTLHGASQWLKTDDRLAYPFGCIKEDIYDRYCSDGTFNFYDFESENERRQTHALSARADGTMVLGGMTHRFSVDALSSRYTARLEPRVDDNVIVGVGTVDGLTTVPVPTGLGTTPNVNRTERSREFGVRDHIELNDVVGLWLGLRHTRLDRDSVRTDGSRATAYEQSVTAPWLAATFALSDTLTTYASWGRGIESDVAPNRARYVNRGEALPALKSRQVELGIKQGIERLNWSVALFDISRPVAGDVGMECDSDTPGDTCTWQADGDARHRGVEAAGTWRAGPWTLQGGLQWLHARRTGSADGAVNGKRPVNVPEATVKAQARYAVDSVPGLALIAGVRAESDRMVLEDNSVRIGGYSQTDIALRYVQSRDSGALIWRAGIDNLFDRRAWREAPFQFGHAYLFPLAPRTLRLSLQADF